MNGTARVMILGDSPYRVETWPKSIQVDLAHLICGEPLGFGIARQVFVLGTDPTKVVKVEIAAGSFQNVIEWQTWNDLRETQYAKYLAPCHHISPCGIVLIQSRVGPLTARHERQPLPSFLTDFKRSNYGVLDRRVVCCDYGTNLLLNHGAFASRMRKPKWRDG